MPERTTPMTIEELDFILDAEESIDALNLAIHENLDKFSSYLKSYVDGLDPNGSINRIGNFITLTIFNDAKSFSKPDEVLTRLCDAGYNPESFFLFTLARNPDFELTDMTYVCDNDFLVGNDENEIRPETLKFCALLYAEFIKYKVSASGFAPEFKCSPSLTAEFQDCAKEAVFCSDMIAIQNALVGLIDDPNSLPLNLAPHSLKILAPVLPEETRNFLWIKAMGAKVQLDGNNELNPTSRVTFQYQI